MMEKVQVLGLVAGGCLVNNFALEVVMSHSPKCGSLVTLLQFSFIAVGGLLLNISQDANRKWWFPFKKPILSMKIHLILAVLFFAINFLNNLAFSYKIAAPLHLIFRSSSLVGNLFCGYFLMNKKYKLYQVFASLLVTVGIIISTLADINVKIKKDCCEPGRNETTTSDGNSDDDLSGMLTGVALLTCSLILTSLLGHIQENAYRSSNTHGVWKEGILYQHLLSLPYFIVLAKDMDENVAGFNQSAPFYLFGASVPYVWIALFVNVLSQFMCICGVFLSTGVLGTFETTMLLTLRKFTSLMLSIVYFHHPFTNSHLIGVALVFMGTILYSKETIMNYIQPNATTNDLVGGKSEKSTRPKTD